MIRTPNETFVNINNFARQSAIGDLMRTRMTKGSVRDHCLTMISHLNRAEVAGVKLGQEMQIDIILRSLHESFNQFTMIYNMNKWKMTPTQLMHELESIENNFARQSAIGDLMRTRMTKGSVRDHCLTMISHLNRAEVAGVKLEQEMQIDIILISLHESFNQFTMSYNMNKWKMTPTQLMQELESVEKSLVKPYSVDSYVKPKNKPKGGNKNKKKKKVVSVVKSTIMKKSKD